MRCKKEKNIILEKNSINLNLNENCFDLLRYYAAFLVFGDHVISKCFGNKQWFLLDGSIGVMIFFSLTGFLTMASYERRVIKGKERYISFLIGRVLRLCPPLFFSMVVIWLFDTFVLNIRTFNGNDLKELLSFLMFRGGRIHSSGISNGVVTWTLRTNFFYYLLIPIIYKLFTDFKKMGGYCIGIATIINFFAIFISIAFSKIGFEADYGLPIYFMFEVLIGTFLYFNQDIILKYKNNKKLILIFVILLYAYFFILIKADNYYLNRLHYLHNTIIGVFVSFFTIIIGYSFVMKKRCLDITYGIYLFHVIALSIVERFDFIVNDYFKILLISIITLALSLLEYYIVENIKIKNKKTVFIKEKKL